MSRSIRVPTGRVVTTARVFHELDLTVIASCLARHLRGDWGDLGEDDSRANWKAIEDGSRLLSKYVVRDEAIYIVTEAEDENLKRPLTTILFTDEY